MSSPWVCRRALLVNCYADETRLPVARTQKVPQPMAPAFLAGMLAPDRWEVRLYNEMSAGPLEDAALLGWPDLAVLSGLITSLDRMRHLTAYIRSLNHRAVIVVGGHLARALPKYCATFADHVCLGDVEELADLVEDMHGPEYVAEDPIPRFDLVDWMGWMGYVESSRYCNFACSFCTLTAERRPFRPEPTEAFEGQVRAVGRRAYLTLLDNNLWGNDRRSFRARMEVLGRLKREGQFLGWGGLVTSDFFFSSSNLELAAESGCVALFSGVESFDPEWTNAHNKKQNGVKPHLQSIHDCLEAGIVFLYGLMLDHTTRHLRDIRRELDGIVDNPDITLPAYVSLPIPIPRTPFFYECLDDGLILPGTKFRDLDSTTISLRPLDGLDETAEFVRDLQSMRGWRMRIARHSVEFVRRHRHNLSAHQLFFALSNAAMIAAPLWATLPRRVGTRAAPRTHVSTTEPLDRCYEPAIPVEARFESYFRPAMLTNPDGELADEICEDICEGRVGEAPLVSISGAPSARG